MKERWTARLIALLTAVTVAGLATAASISSWDASYETGTFSDSTQVNQLDDLIDVVLESIRGRAEAELCWGTNDADGCGAADNGRAREGAARAFHVADCSAVANLNAEDDNGSATLGAGDDGRLCIDSDTGETYYWTGSAWRALDPGFNGVLAYRTTSSFAVNDSASTPLQFNAESFDLTGWHDNSTNPSRFTVPTGVSHVDVGCSVAWASNATGNRSLTIQLGGASVIGGGSVRQAAVSGNSTLMQVHGSFPVVAGEYIECVGFQDSGGALNMVNSSSDSWMYVRAVR